MKGIVTIILFSTAQRIRLVYRRNFGYDAKLGVYTNMFGYKQVI